jgi:hypothetical protein
VSHEEHRASRSIEARPGVKKAVAADYFAGELSMDLGKAAFEELMKTDEVAEVSAGRLVNRDGGNAHGSSEPFDCRVIN